MRLETPGSSCSNRTARRVESHPRVTVNAGRVALVRGPVVYCVEAADHGGSTRDLAPAADALARDSFRPGLLGGVTVLEATGRQGGRRSAITAVPYAVWANRGAGHMDVWLPVAPR